MGGEPGILASRGTCGDEELGVAVVGALPDLGLVVVLGQAHRHGARARVLQPAARTGLHPMLGGTHTLLFTCVKAPNGGITNVFHSPAGVQGHCLQPSANKGRA